MRVSNKVEEYIRKVVTKKVEEKYKEQKQALLDDEKRFMHEFNALLDGCNEMVKDAVAAFFAREGVSYDLTGVKLVTNNYYGGHVNTSNLPVCSNVRNMNFEIKDKIDNAVSGVILQMELGGGKLEDLNRLLDELEV